MSRPESQMTEAERRELNTYRQRLESPMSTTDERIEAQRKIEEIQWRGPTASFRQNIADFRERLDALESKGGGGKGGVGKKQFAALEDMVGHLRSEVNDMKEKFDGAIADVTAQIIENAQEDIRAAAIVAVSELMGDPDPVEEDEPLDDIPKMGDSQFDNE